MDFLSKIFLIVSWIFVMGCASTQPPKGIAKYKSLKSDSRFATYFGKKGYLMANPYHQGTWPDFKNERFSGESDFIKCEPIIVDDIVEDELSNKIRFSEDVYLFVSQGQKKFVLSIPGFNTKYLLLKGPEELVKDPLPFKNRKIRGNEGSFESKDLVCKGTIFTSMTGSELQFVLGSPEKINSTVVHGAPKTEQWVYPKRGGSEFAKDYFYFRNGILTSWQN